MGVIFLCWRDIKPLYDINHWMFSSC